MTWDRCLFKSGDQGCQIWAVVEQPLPALNCIEDLLGISPENVAFACHFLPCVWKKGCTMLHQVPKHLSGKTGQSLQHVLRNKAQLFGSATGGELSTPAGSKTWCFNENRQRPKGYSQLCSTMFNILPILVNIGQSTAPTCAASQLVP